MSNVAKVAGAAANTLTTPLNIEEVFSTYLYEGNASTQTITNGIDLAGEGGLTWIKSRTNTGFHFLFDTERGATEALSSELTNGEITRSTSLTAFHNNAFDLGSFAASNGSGQDYASWTFRKAPKFFDCVTWTGDGVQGRSISHNLGSVPGVIITKKLNATDNWVVYHRSIGAGKMIYLNSTTSTLNNTAVYPTTPTDSVFYVGNDSAVNGTSSDTYVAYLFAHNDGDGDYGPDGNADIIKCGSYTGNGSSTGPTVDLGFEPQWILTANSSTAQYWSIYDSMRGLPVGGDDARLHPNRSDAENTTFGALIDLLPNGFRPAASSNQINQSGDVYLYVAIRRGPMAVPESATDVFHVRQGSATADQFFSTGFDPDLLFSRDATNAAANNFLGARLTSQRDGAQNLMWTNATTAETATSGRGYFGAKSKGYYFDDTRSESMNMAWGRAPNFFDVVIYTGTGSALTVNHNLGVEPDMIWVKSRDQARNWEVYHSGIASDAETDYIELNQRYAAQDNANFWNDTKPTSSVFSLGISASVNNSAENYIAYLFASLSGVSKVGSYTGNGTNQTIDCGFSSGARFILIKRSDQGSGIIAAGDWHVFDTERGVVAGNDPYLELNTSNAEVTSEDAVDPDSSGFIVNEVSGSNINTSGNTYIFYAIA